MKCYVVTASSGEYEDYRKWNERIFTNKESAEKYKENFNIQLRERQQQGMICENCIVATQDCEDLTNEDFDILNSTCTYNKKDLQHFESIPGFFCENQMHYYCWRDEYEADVEEFELYE